MLDQLLNSRLAGGIFLQELLDFRQPHFLPTIVREH